MSRNRWFIWMIVLLMFIILAIAYTVFITGQDPEPRRVSVIVDDSGSARWNLFREGVREAAEDQGLTVNVVSTGRFADADEEKELIARQLDMSPDGLIIQPRAGSDPAQLVPAAAGRRPVVFVDTAEGISIDNARAGRLLAEEIIALEACGSRRTVSVILDEALLSPLRERFDAMEETLSAAGFSVRTLTSEGIVELSAAGPGERMREEVLAALDNRSLELAVDLVRSAAVRADPEAGEDLIPIYGIGTSNKAIYFLDRGVIRSLIVPDEFSMGYQAVTDMAGRLTHRVRSSPALTIDCKAVRQEDLFSEENQTLLFPPGS